MSPTGEPNRLSGRQQEVYRSLAETDANLAELYSCALHTLHDDRNTGRTFMAAHSIRELMNALPKVLDLPVEDAGRRLGDQVNALVPIWEAALESGCHKDGEWSGTIDRPLRNLLKKLRALFQWWADSRPRRRDIAVRLFRTTDPAGMPLPEPIEQKRARRWLDLLDYFNRTAHRASTTDSELAAMLGNLEQVLLDSLYRSPSEDFSSIDAILLEEAADA